METNKPENAGSFYNSWTEKFLQVYDGNTIQGYRPPQLEELHLYTIQHADLQDGQTLLDAGCGVCGPSIYFASKLNLQIEAITISTVQASLAEKNVEASQLKGRINVTTGDFHDLALHYEANTFDRAIFLESLGHSADPEKVIDGLAKVLKPGGKVYIKDVYRKISKDAIEQEKINNFFEQMDKFYAYHTLSLEKVIEALRSNSFEIEFIKKIEYQNDTTFRDTFENKFDIDLFKEDPLLNPGEWLEIGCQKTES